MDMVETPAAAPGQQSPAQDALLKEFSALGFHRETLDALADAINATRLLEFAPGDTLFREGDEVDALYLISEGRIKLLNYLENGQTRIIRLHNSGSVIGLNGLMDEVHTNTAVAIDTLQVYQISMSLVKGTKAKSPQAYCQLLEYSHAYLNMADTWITDFSTGAIRGRVARLIRFLAENDQATASKEVSLLTVEEMANILGVTPESVSRIMADLKRKKTLQAVEHSSPDHYLCDMKAIMREAER